MELIDPLRSCFVVYMTTKKCWVHTSIIISWFLVNCNATINIKTRHFLSTKEERKKASQQTCKNKYPIIPMWWTTWNHPHPKPIVTIPTHPPTHQHTTHVTIVLTQCMSSTNGCGWLHLLDLRELVSGIPSNLMTTWYLVPVPFLFFFFSVRGGFLFFFRSTVVCVKSVGGAGQQECRYNKVRAT